MGLNLQNTVQSRVTDSTIGAIGGQIGLDPATAKAASAVLVPLVLVSMAKIAAQRTGGETVQQLIGASQYDGSLLEQLPAMLSGGKADELAARGSQLIKRLLGPDADPIVAMVSKQLGLKPTALRSLWAMLTPLIIDVIAGKVAAQQWHPKALRSSLISSQNTLAKALPVEVAEHLGLRTSSVKHASSEAKSAGFDISYVIAFIVSALIVFALAQYVFKPAGVEDALPPVPQTEVPLDSVAPASVPETLPEIAPETLPEDVPEASPAGDDESPLPAC
jgi:hypothetical protein